MAFLEGRGLESLTAAPENEEVNRTLGRDSSMKRFVVGFLLMGEAFAGAAAVPSHPFPPHTLYAESILRPSRVSPDEQVAVVTGCYARWKAKYLRGAGATPAAQPRFRVAMSDKPDGKTTSESQGYGMTILPVMAGHDPDARAIFDGLWSFTKDHRSDGDGRLMDWEVMADEARQKEGNSSAFDGDADIALGLLMADAQWGSDGPINYRQEALAILDGLGARCIGKGTKLPLLGDWVSPEEAKFNDRTVRTSDFMLINFRAFAAAGHTDDWRATITASQGAIDQLQRDYAPATGLLPDFTVAAREPAQGLAPSPGRLLESKHDGAFNYNACRAPWRIGLDAALTGDSRSRAQARRIAEWARKAAEGDPQKIRAGYKLDGTPLPNSDYFSGCFAAPIAVATMSDPAGQAWLDDLFDAMKDVDQGYYEDSINLLCLMAITGNYWAPPMGSPAAPDGPAAGK